MHRISLFNAQNAAREAYSWQLRLRGHECSPRVYSGPGQIPGYTRTPMTELPRLCRRQLGAHALPLISSVQEPNVDDRSRLTGYDVLITIGTGDGRTVPHSKQPPTSWPEAPSTAVLTGVIARN